MGGQTVAQRARPEGHWEAGAGAGGALLVRALGGGQGHPQGHSGEDRAAGPRGPGCGPRRSVTGFSPHRPREAGDSLRHLPEGGHQNRQPGEAQRVCADEGERGAGPGGPGRGLGCGEARLGGPSVAMPAPRPTAQSPAPGLVQAPASACSLAWSGPVPRLRLLPQLESEQTSASEGHGGARGRRRRPRLWSARPHSGVGPPSAGRWGSPSSSRTPSPCPRGCLFASPLVNSLLLPGPSLAHPGPDGEQACPAGRWGHGGGGSHRCSA